MQVKILAFLIFSFIFSVNDEKRSEELVPDERMVLNIKNIFWKG